MRTNYTKVKLEEGRVVFGAIISRYAPDLVELFGAIGYDFVMIDCEHGPMDLDQVEHMVRAAEVFDITPIARIPDHADSTILRYLDRGVQGIIVPHVNTREEADAVVRAARYYPDGHRGVGGGRAHDYGVNTPLPSQVVPLGPGRCLMMWTKGPRNDRHRLESLRGPTPGRKLVNPCSSTTMRSMVTSSRSPFSAPST